MFGLVPLLASFLPSRLPSYNGCSFINKVASTKTHDQYPYTTIRSNSPTNSISLAITRGLKPPKIAIITTVIIEYSLNDFHCFSRYRPIPMVSMAGNMNIALIPTKTKCIVPLNVVSAPIGSCGKIDAVNDVIIPEIIISVPPMNNNLLCLYLKFETIPTPKRTPPMAEISMIGLNRRAEGDKVVALFANSGIMKRNLMEREGFEF